MTFNSLAVIRGGYHTHAYSDGLLVYVAKEVCLYSSAFAGMLPFAVGNDRHGVSVERASGDVGRQQLSGVIR